MRFAGKMISKHGAEQDENNIKAIRKLPRPSELKEFIQLAEQLASELPSYKRNKEKLKQLMNSKKDFKWKEHHTQDFRNTRNMLTSKAIIYPFDKIKRTSLLTSKSRIHGIGFVLMQNPNAEGKDQLIMYRSRCLTKEKADYATMELEVLAILYAFRTCKLHLQNLEQFKVKTTYRPLQGVFQHHMHDMDNGRLLRIREKPAEYSFNISGTHGKQNKIADALCKAPNFHAIEEKLTTSTSIQLQQHWKHYSSTTTQGIMHSGQTSYIECKFDTQKWAQSSIQEDMEQPQCRRQHSHSTATATHLGLTATLQPRCSWAEDNRQTCR